MAKLRPLGVAEDEHTLLFRAVFALTFKSVVIPNPSYETDLRRSSPNRSSKLRKPRVPKISVPPPFVESK